MNETNDYKYADGQGNSNDNDNYTRPIMFTNKKQTNKQKCTAISGFSIHFAFCRAVRRGRAATNQTIPVSGDRDELPAADGP
jgi:hypothetical protein